MNKRPDRGPNLGGTQEAYIEYIRSSLADGCCLRTGCKDGIGTLCVEQRHCDTCEEFMRRLLSAEKDKWIDTAALKARLTGQMFRDVLAKVKHERPLICGGRPAQ